MRRSVEKLITASRLRPQDGTGWPEMFATIASTYALNAQDEQYQSKKELAADFIVKKR